MVEIFFLDAQHGWAMSERNKLMATTDGSTWAELGTLPGTSRGLRFSSPETDFFIDNHDSTALSHLNRTDDGGRTWTRAHPCGLDAVIGGLPRRLGCSMRVTQFVTPQAGFMAGGAPIDMGTSVTTFSKTTDGGATWISTMIPATKHTVDSIHFWSENDGLALLANLLDGRCGNHLDHFGESPGLAQLLRNR